MPKETYETATGIRELKILDREEEKNILNFAGNYINNNWNKALLTIHGLAGSGKSTLVKTALRNIQNNYKNIFCVYLDVSNCLDESEIYYKIALHLKHYYDSFSLIDKNDIKQERKNINLLIRLYEWLKGINRENIQTYEQNSKTFTDITSFINDKINEVSKNNEEKNDNTSEAPKNNEEKIDNIFLESLVDSTLLKLSKALPIVSSAKSIFDIIANIHDTYDTIKFKRLLLEKIDTLNNRVMSEHYFLEQLCKGLYEKTKCIIILDNFQMNPDIQLGRDYTWLTAQNKLMNKFNSMWIVVSRMQTNELFEHLFQAECRSDIELKGFSEEMAKEYLIINCIDNGIYNNYKFQDKPVQTLINQMLYAADINNDKYYLPYLLRMIVLYYWKVKENPSITITPDMFLKLRTEEEFIGYYFYKDLSDLMINAFQILSCLSTWDDIWIDTVQKKIDNHLLNARNLLEHKAPIEPLDNSPCSNIYSNLHPFKLHEALREGLYNNKQNYIKKDVLKHLFDTFINIYEGNEIIKNKDIWNELERIQTFIDIVFSYLDLDNEQKKEKLKSIRNAMNNIYQNQKARGTVSKRFIDIYCSYIDKLKEFYNIAFATTLNNNFENEKPEQWKQAIIEYGEQEQLIYYMTCCFNLADLYTNNNQNGIAQRLEKLCVQFWDNQLKITDINTIWYYKCWQQKVKALNATAYDYSAEHNYKMAYYYGKKGLEEAEKLGNNILNEIDLKNKNNPELVKTLKILLNPDEQEIFLVNGVYTEIPYALYNKMEKAYKELWKIKYPQQDSKKDENEVKIYSLKCILSELLIKNQQDLRGNFPWYCLMNNELVPNNEKQKKDQRKEYIIYGVRTYWMRRAMLEALKKSKLQEDSQNLKNVTERMLTSYHNICVYLSKNSEIEKACLLANEALKESKRIMPKGKPSKTALEFMKNILEKERAEKEEKEEKEEKGNTDSSLSYYLYKQQKLSEETGKDFFSQPPIIIEQMQYLGDFYLHMGYYSFALQWLSVVMLMRIGSLGISDSKTLDTALRFYITVYAVHEEKDKLFKQAKKYFNETVIKEAGYIEKLRKNKEAEGVLQKFEKMAELLNLSNAKANINDTVANMLSVID